MASFVIEDDQFRLDGNPFQVLSGAIHYFRVPREYWGDRIRKAREMGLNTIETYVAWNLHEPTPGQWITSGNLDLGGFLDEVAAQGMKAIVRPGPFICAEFNGGGLPAWLLDSGQVPVRGSDPRYLEPTLAYLEKVYEIVSPRQIDQDGTVILVQIENEYGAYGRDLNYLQALTDCTRSAGISVPLTTVDQPRPDMLPFGTLPELLATASFGSRSPERLEYLRQVQPTGPLMCSEYWDGWFDQWGEYHHVTSAADSAADLDLLLGAGASVNLYMFHGGTNFGFTNGANDKGLYRAIVTSYDYDAPLDEAGNPTEKYWAYREVLSKYNQVNGVGPVSAPPAPTPVAVAEATVSFRDSVDWADGWQTWSSVPTFDQMQHYEGFGLYRTQLPAASSTDDGQDRLLYVEEIRDRATVFADGKVIGTLERVDNDNFLAVPAGTRELVFLVEDMGRVNYGPRIGEPKGIIGPVRLGTDELTVWQTKILEYGSAPVQLEADKSSSGDLQITEPTFIKFTVSVEKPTDLFLKISDWGKGLVWVNGQLLGRYWRRGALETLYVPGPWLHAGDNDILVFETEPVSAQQLQFVAEAALGPIDW